MRLSSRKLNTRKFGRAGQAIVEFAIVIPVLLVLLLGLIEWGFLLWAQTTYVNAVRDASRVAVTVEDWDSNQAARETEVINIVVNRVSALPPSLTQDVANRVVVELIPNAANLNSIRVSIAGQPYNPIIGFAQALVPANLSATAEFRYEGGP